MTPDPGPVRELSQMLGQMKPELRSGAYVFVTVPRVVPAGLHPVMTFTEDEGLSLVLPQVEADAAGLAYDLVTAWVTLTVHSALDGVGLTAAVSGALADIGISCNIVAATFHDHLFVPVADAAATVAALERLSAAADAGERG